MCQWIFRSYSDVLSVVDAEGVSFIVIEGYDFSIINIVFSIIECSICVGYKVAIRV